MNAWLRGSRVAAGLLAWVVLATGCALGEADGAARPPDTPAAPTPGPVLPPDRSGTVEVLVTGLEVPWDIAFLPGGAALVTERDTARLLQVGPEFDGAELQVTELRTVTEADPGGEGGLLGVAVSPDYQTDQTIFLYYTTAADNRIARLTPGTPPDPIVTGIPLAGNHNGGQLAFGPDGYLYASTGDAGEPSRAQDRDNLAGKILRMTPDGQPAPGNPFDSLVWSYGHRNVQGLAWDADGRLWASEFGANAWDEINLIEPAGNYGWPEVEGTGGGERFTDPKITWPTREASCSGLAVAGATLTAACLRGQRLWRMELTGSGTILGAPRPMLEREYGRLRAATVAPDGSLWVSTSNRDGRLPGGPEPDDDRILRVSAGVAGAGRS